VLQPLVENAVTHGIAHVLEGGVIRIAAERGAAILRIRVDNPCDRDRPAGRGTGVGLANVRARLRTLYGTDAALSTQEVDGRFIAQIDVPIEKGSVK
jgi:two-component system sensor histidine kinase AlgZ